ncbi:hypothetical protein AC579_1532 [Pseudocercospora musae]|uniref:Uncharacterized protein n=1 Tax=Pseudocercospora musae TaxID=113226 RepID=A0A139IM52_9PEZI|nr:hypothetical protein AC579_1532 [Pseudocercospora musae]
MRGTHTHETYTDTPDVDSAPITGSEEPSSEGLASISYLLLLGDSSIEIGKLAQLRRPTWFYRPNGCLDLNREVKERKRFDGHLPANSYYDPGPC